MSNIRYFDRDSWIEIFHSLKKNKLRTFFTAFGVFWGIFMLVIMLGSGKGLENGTTEGWGDMSKNSIFLWGNNTSLPYKGFDKGRFIQFNNKDTEALKENIEQIEFIAPKINHRPSTNSVIRKDRSSSNNISGEMPEAEMIDPSDIIMGRYINYNDVDNNRKVAVLGIRAYEELFENDEDPIGEYIQIEGVNFVVIGVKSSRQLGNEAYNENSEIVIPFSTLQKTFNKGDKVYYYVISAKPQYNAKAVLGEITEFLKLRHSISPRDLMAIGSFDLSSEFKKLSDLFFGIDALIWIVGLGTLFAGIVGVSNIMLIVVKERTQEIGIKRAVGATPNDIRIQIVLESVFLTLLAGYIGLAFGVGIVELVDYTLIQFNLGDGTFKRPAVDFQKAISALVIIVLSGVFAGIIPAQRAVKLKPIEALRDE
jgi:putative ABC transport system permease protein